MKKKSERPKRVGLECTQCMCVHLCAIYKMLLDKDFEMRTIFWGVLI